MRLRAAEGPALFVKKIGGLAFLLVGLVTGALGYAEGRGGLVVLGGVLVAAGAVLLMLKVRRRNRL